MRLIRMTLANFRGITSHTIEFARSGVTIIEGPNEAGKSSIAEALDLLFEIPDNSVATPVKLVKPVHLDEGSEVEVELVSGPYHVVYGKRWHNRQRTNLEVRTPRPESLTGREAHDRMREILAETLDLALWKALRYEQGVAISQAAIADSPSLSAALDAAASGASPKDGAESGVWDQVKAEWSEYFTTTGRPIQARKALEERVATASAAVQDLSRSVVEIEEMAERYHRLGSDLSRAESRLGELSDLVGGYQKKCEELDGEVRRVQALASAVDLAESRRAQAAQQVQAREQLIAEVTELTDKLAAIEAVGAEAAPRIQAEQLAFAEAEAALSKARAARAAADSAREVAAADLGYFGEIAELASLSERLEAARQAESRRSKAAETVETAKINPERLEAIEAAYMDVIEAKAAVAADGATVDLAALADLEVVVSGVGRTLATGERMEEVVGGQLELVLPGIAAITIRTAASAREAQERLSMARGRLDALYAAVGVWGDDGLGEARRLEQLRKEAVAEEARASEICRSSLGDLTFGLIEERIARLGESSANYLAARAPGGVPVDLEAARKAAEAATDQARSAAELERDRTDALEEARSRLEVLANAANRRVADEQMTRQYHKRALEALAEARERGSDDEIRSVLREAEAAVAAAGEALAEARAALESENPEGIALLLDAAKAERDGLMARAREIERERIRIKSILDDRAEAGYQDRLDAAVGELAAVEREKAQIDRRAAAADLLYRTLERHRDQAQRSYAEPLRERIESLSRLVFGDGVAVHLNHSNLAIDSRTVNGVTVPYASLSMGAKEQLCLLARLACAGLVNPGSDVDGGGVPVIIDDALGYTDSVRLERVGAVLGAAARTSQVIVLTCVPDRFGKTQPAKVIRLDRQATNPGQGAL